MIPASWFPPGSALLLISRGQAARPLSAQAQHPLASAPAGKREEARLSGGRGKGGSVQEQLTFSWRYPPRRLRSYSGPPEPGRWRSPALRPKGITWGTPAELDSGNCLLTWTDKPDHTAGFSKLWKLLQG